MQHFQLMKWVEMLSWLLYLEEAFAMRIFFSMHRFADTFCHHVHDPGIGFQQRGGT